MKYRKLSLVAIVFFAIVAMSFTAEARRGCCSHHGGVCGCQCCDGTPLSAKCAPYYPSCNDSGSRHEQKEDVYSQDKKESVYVGSVNSDKYHYPSCRWAKKISSHNLTKFGSAEEARKKGYVPCKVCNPPWQDKKK